MKYVTGLIGLIFFGSLSQAQAMPIFFKNGSVQIDLQFVKPPQVGEESMMIVQAKEARTQQPVDLHEELSVELWMPSMGHGSAPTQVERILNQYGDRVVGAYRVRNMYFVMDGEWEVRVILVDERGQQEVQSIRLNLLEE